MKLAYTLKTPRKKEDWILVENCKVVAVEEDRDFERLFCCTITDENGKIKVTSGTGAIKK